jgi:hypothetical protein
MISLTLQAKANGRVRLAVWLLAVGLAHLNLFAQTSTRNHQKITYKDLPALLRGLLSERGLSDVTFAAYVASIDHATAEREREGEFDHLIFYLLQSQSFTKFPRIEPALSSYEYVMSLSEGARHSYLAGESEKRATSVAPLPKPVRDRISDFSKAVKGHPTDVRLQYFKRLLNMEADPTVRLTAEYMRAMRFLYQKEFGSQKLRPEEVAGYVASLYTLRGHSTDTQIEANYAVYTALAALKAQNGAQAAGTINRVLIIGPGLDFAPRTDLIDAFPPQTYQPFAVMDALLSLKLANPARLRIDCVDINERVIDHLRTLKQNGPHTLRVFTGLADVAAHPLTEDFKVYFNELGCSIGRSGPLTVPPEFHNRLKKSILVRPEIIERIHSEKLNIITERDEASPKYDLVVVTNVFPYFNQLELLLALSNISKMLGAGGYLIHNELQSIPSLFVQAVGLPLVQARTVLISSGDSVPLFDGIAVHQKK